MTAVARVAGGLIVAFGLAIPSHGVASQAPHPPLAVDSGFIDVPGGHLFYEAAGHGDVVVLVHDGLLHRVTWDEQFPTLADSFRVVRYDRRGYGRSPDSTQPFSDIEDLKAVLDAVNAHRVVVVGCSAGGGLALDFTIAYPQLVRALVVVGGVVSGVPYSEHFLTRGGRWTKELASASVDRVINYWTKDDPYYISANSPAVRARVRTLLKLSPHDVSNHRRSERPSWTAVNRLAEIHMPTLIVVGEYDIPDVHSHAGVMQAGIRNARRIVVSGAGHLVQLERPDVFNGVLRRFLAAVF